MNIDYKLIGERIRHTRKVQGMTQEQLAEQLNVSIGYVSQVERGITKISLDLLAAISSVLDCDVAFLISECALKSNKYMESEIIEEIKKLDAKKRKLVLELIRVINTNL